jgi:omega-amidase
MPMTSHLRVTLVQTDIAWQAPATNRRALAAHFRGLMGHTDLIVLPEMFSTGFSMDAEGLAETMDGPTVGWMREEAAATGCAITGSVIVRDGEHCYNRLVWARPDGTLEHYDKRHLFRMANEQRHYAAGSRRLIVEFKGWRLCPMICYDLRFPVWSRNWGDYDVLLYVANWPQRRAHAWSTLLKARAIEDGNGATYAGDSVALDFLGQPLSSEGGGDRVETAVLDLESLQKYREAFPAHLDADRYDIVD